MVRFDNGYNKQKAFKRKFQNFKIDKHIVGCRGVLQLGGLVPVLLQLVPLSYKASKSVVFTYKFTDFKNI